MNSPRPLCCAALAVLLTAVGAPAQVTKLGLGDKTTALVADPAATQGSAVGIRIAPTATGPTNQWALAQSTLAPGLYRFTIKLRFLIPKDFDAGGLLLHLQVRSANNLLLELPLDWGVCDGRPGAYTTVTREFSVIRPAKPVLTCGWELAASDSAESPAPVKPVKLPSLATATTSLDARKEDDFTGDFDASVTAAKPASLDSIDYPVILLDTAEIQLITDSLAIEKVWPQKIHVYPGGESNPVIVIVRNYQSQPATAMVRLTDQTGVDEMGPPQEARLPVPASGTATQAFAWSSGAREYGHGACAEILVDGRVVQTRTDYFSVARPVWKTAIQGPGLAAWFGHESNILPHVKFERQSYVNVEEAYGWQPSSWTDLNPTNADWWTGQRNSHNSLSGLRLWMDLSHCYGIKLITYSGPAAYGTEGFDWARRHPDLVRRGNDGMEIEGYDVETLRLASLIRARPELAAFQPAAPSYLWPDKAALGAIALGATEVIRSANHFGWDGVCFETPPGTGVTPDGGHAGLGYFTFGNPPAEDAVALSGRNVRYLRERFTGEINSNFAIAYDFALDLDPRSGAPKDPPVAKFQAECAHGGGMIMDEQIRSIAHPCCGSWKAYWTDIRQQAQLVRENAGYQETIGVNGSPWPRAYLTIFTLAAGSHPALEYGWSQPLPGQYPAFVTRYSEYCWDLALQPIAAETAGLRVDDHAGILWKPFTRDRSLPNGGTRTVIQLITPPTDDAITPTPASPPAPWSTNVTVHKRGAVRPNVWRLSAEPDIQCEKLAARADGDGFTVTIPEHRVWTILVWDEGAK